MSPALLVNIIVLSTAFISIINLLHGEETKRLPRPDTPRPGTHHLTNSAKSPSSQFTPRTYTLARDSIIEIDRPTLKISPLRRAKKINRLERTKPVADLRAAFLNGANSNVACARHSSVDKFLDVVDEHGKPYVYGQGSFGAIVKVINEETGKFYVKKKMPSYLEENQNEIAVIKHIQKSPGICPFIVTFEAYEECALPEKDGQKYIYLIMEELRGGDMFDHLRDYSRITSNLALLYTYQIVLALKYMHENGIMYRDIKDENIMMLLSWDEKAQKFRLNGRIKLVDFGLSLIGEESTEYVGSPGYMAPEVIEEKKYGKTIDFWSVGALVFRMIYGFFPFRRLDIDIESANSIEIHESNTIHYAQGNRNVVQYPSHIDIDQKCKSFIIACLTADPSKRVNSGNVLSQSWIADNKILSNGILSKVHDPEKNLMEFTKNELWLSEEKFHREETRFKEQRRGSFAERMAQRNQQNPQPNVITVSREPGQAQNSNPNGYNTVIHTPGNTN